MKIVFVITRADSLGGAQTHLRDLVKGVLDDHHSASVVTGPKGVFSTILEDIGVEVIECGDLGRKIRPGKDLRALSALRRIIREQHPDVVCIHSSKAGLLGRIASRFEGVPCVFTAHGWAFSAGVPEPRRAIALVLERLSAPLATAIICVSDYDRRLAIGNGIRPDRVRVIHNGVKDIPAAQRANPAVGGPVRIVMIARFDRQKDHATLIHALRDVRNAQLDLVGDGPNVPSIKRLVAELAMADRVNFLGYQSDVASVLARAHIFALTSNWEGFPQSTLEAMRAGLPILVSRVGGADEAIDDGVTGFAIARGDIGAVREKLGLLTSNPMLRSQMGAAARRKYEREFTFERMYTRTIDLYRDIIYRH